MAFRSFTLVAASVLLLPLAFACSGDSSNGDNDTTPFTGVPPVDQTPPSATPTDTVPPPGETDGDGTDVTPPATDEGGPAPVGLDDGEAQPPGTGEGTGETPAPLPEDEDVGEEIGTVEDSGVDCVRPALPAANQLPAIATHPDPFLMTDGTRITTKAQWTCRRAELKAQVEEYESGPKPVVDKANVTGTFAANQLTVSVNDAGRNASGVSPWNISKHTCRIATSAA